MNPCHGCRVSVKPPGLVGYSASPNVISSTDITPKAQRLTAYNIPLISSYENSPGSILEVLRSVIYRVDHPLESFVCAGEALTGR